MVYCSTFFLEWRESPGPRWFLAYALSEGPEYLPPRLQFQIVTLLPEIPKFVLRVRSLVFMRYVP